MNSDTVILKLHNGDPGPEYTDHLVGGDGMPQEWSASETREIHGAEDRACGYAYRT